MDQPPGLDDPDQARFAWARFRRLLGWVALVAMIAAGLSIWGLTVFYGTLGWVATLATIGGVMVTVMMAGALMGLAFLSSGTGHDAAVRDYSPSPDRRA